MFRYCKTLLQLNKSKIIIEQQKKEILLLNNKLKFEPSQQWHEKFQNDFKIWQKWFEDEKINFTKEIIIKSLCLIQVNNLVLPQCKRWIEIPKEDAKTYGRLIGKNGKNRLAFQEITGVDLSINSCKNNFILLSKYDTIKIELASRLITKLINIKKFSIENMKSIFEKECQKFQKENQEFGTEFAEKKLNFTYVNPKLAEYIGILRYRFSYQQNLFEHCWETAQFTANIAMELKLNTNTALHAGFFHDIGKVFSSDDHVKSGIEIAKKFNLGEIVINTIASHHGQIPANNEYSQIVKTMDYLSASRIGARHNENNYVQERKKIILQLFDNIPWIEKITFKSENNHLIFFILSDYFDQKNISYFSDEINKKLNKFNFKKEFHIELKFLYSKSYFYKNE